MEKIKKKEKEVERLNKKLNYLAKQTTKYLDQEQEGYIIPDEGEETNKFQQEKMKEFLPSFNSNNIFDLALPHGPFKVKFSNNGRRLLLAGRSSAAVLNWKNKEMQCEINLDKQEKIKDITFINNDNMIALSQEESLGIFDNQGLEIHNLTKYYKPRFLQDLPYHYLLVSSTKNK